MAEAQVSTEYLAEDHCSGAMEIFLDVFVAVKAVTLIYFSGQGILWFLKNKFTAIAVIFVLLISCVLVSKKVLSILCIQFMHLCEDDVFLPNRLYQRWLTGSQIEVFATDSCRTPLHNGKSSAV